MSESLSPDEIARYARHLSLPQVGARGQLRLKNARVLVVGAGGIGTPALVYLAAAGIGELGVVDFDRVETSNLQRQILYTPDDLGQPKADVAARKLAAQNPLIQVRCHDIRLDETNARELVGAYDLVINGVDTLPVRYLLNDACVLEKRPQVHGAVHRFQGEVALFSPGGPCYRCLHPNPPPTGSVPSCDDAGILGAIPGVVGTLQATLALRFLLGLGEPAGKITYLDLLAFSTRTLALPRDPACPVCGDNPSIHDVSAIESGCDSSPTPRKMDAMFPEISPRELKERLDRGDDFVLLDVREPHEFAFAQIPGAILIPLGTLPTRASELDPDAEIVLMCRSGKRSADALAFLRSRGFENLANLRGGILAWSDDVDPSVPKY